MDNLSEQIKSLRNEYSDLDLLQEDLSKNPIQQFRKWLDDAIETKIYEPNAMVLATSNNEMPRSRYVLFKNIIEDKIIFHTHYESPKALEIFSNPNVSGIFYWAEIHRQVRFQGIAKKASSKISDESFASRPRGGQLSAWASYQSRLISSRDDVTKKIDELNEKYKNQEIPRPDFWGGFHFKPYYFEFWTGDSSRINKREVFEFKGKDWQKYFLEP